MWCGVVWLETQVDGGLIDGFFVFFLLRVRSEKIKRRKKQMMMMRRKEKNADKDSGKNQRAAKRKKWLSTMCKILFLRAFEAWRK
jgi:hypothetical protein